jgi:hypothetical protein
VISGRPGRPSWPSLGRQPASLAGCFLDVDGEPLLDRLIELTDVAARVSRPISFQ